MSQKKYPTLRKANYDAAVEIACQLKEKKAISEKTFGDIYAESNGIKYRHGSFNTLMETTKKFLLAHGVVEFHQINGLNLWVATQKCVRTQIQNMFVEYQYVTNAAIDKAIAYQTTNDGLVPSEIEGKVIGKNILGLTGKVAAKFTEDYSDLKTYFEEINMAEKSAPGTPMRTPQFEMKFAILTIIRNTKSIKKQ